ncbi:poly-beta-hydroxybutyrate polymerase [Lysobacter arseniciresistens ZS79]|uniref:Poly(3-hydroxyalkanoate) polymerase subunit PhaC n=1 Tax=Lysobacter arseniciresistens ZS79 TaxID=913325 RepID=A0A0A0F783_9GAMM|nr:class III poly(R)-hydroxyalkanoic acid synthase subunit PhaC [Lysobacter arseniciresistens]KGM57232.1 poly-beta-hydroxybutyrate polymerase [Lysobacter arseniciresistens ZS79]
MDNTHTGSIGPLDITPESLAQEAMQFQARLGAGLDTLRQLGDTGYGATPKEEVWRDGKVVLYRYRGDRLDNGRAPTAKVPLLIAYALVNRPYMVDLQADKSIVRGLLERGEDVYILDWGYPDRSDRFLDLEDYIQRYLGGAVDHLRREYRLDAVNLLGICQGGAFSLCYAALNPRKVRNLVTMVTPVDFHTADNMLAHWVRGTDIDLMVDTLGNIPADVMNFTYLTLKPWRLFVQKYVGLVDILDDPRALEDFLRMETWIFDSPDQAGEAFRQFARQFYQANGFVNGGIDIGGRAVDLGDVDMPVLNVFAQADHLVPPSSSQALGGLVGSRDYSELSFRGGHIGIYVSSRAQREVPQAIHDWLAERSR